MKRSSFDFRRLSSKFDQRAAVHLCGLGVSSPREGANLCWYASATTPRPLSLAYCASRVRTHRVAVPVLCAFCHSPRFADPLISSVQKWRSDQLSTSRASKPRAIKNAARAVLSRLAAYSRTYSHALSGAAGQPLSRSTSVPFKMGATYCTGKDKANVATCFCVQHLDTMLARSLPRAIGAQVLFILALWSTCLFPVMQGRVSAEHEPT